MGTRACARIREDPILGIRALPAGTHEDQPRDLVRAFGSVVTGHGAAQGVTSDILLPDTGVLFHDAICGIRIEDRQMDGPLHQDRIDPAAGGDLLQKGQIGCIFYFGSGVKNPSTIEWEKLLNREPQQFGKFPVFPYQI